MDPAPFQRAQTATLTIYLSRYLSMIYLSVYLSKHLSKLLVYLSLHSSNLLTIDPSIYLSFHLSVSRSIFQLPPNRKPKPQARYHSVECYRGLELDGGVWTRRRSDEPKLLTGNQVLHRVAGVGVPKI